MKFYILLIVTFAILTAETQAKKQKKKKSAIDNYSE